MKKLLSCLLVLIFAFTSIISAYAESNNYDLDELGLEVTIPTEYSVITRNTPSNDSIFNELGITKSTIISQFESNDIYLNAISNSSNEEIVVTMQTNSLTNFSLLSDTTLNALATTVVNQYTDYGINVSKYEIYHHSQAKFVRLYFTDTANTVHGLQYYTIYDGKAMNFTMRSYEGNLSTRQESTIKTIVDSIKYDKAPPVSDPGEDTNSFIHTDTESGVIFTVPANWKQEEFSKDREFIDVKFVSTKEDGCMIIYGSTDIWEQMSASEKVGLTRDDLNNSYLSKAEIADMCGTTVDEIYSVTYNGVQYYKFEINYTSDIYGFDISATITELIYINNGWLYTFQFSGASTHKLYSDFENVLKSVQYTTASNVAGVGYFDNTNPSSDNSNYKFEDNSDEITVVLLLFAIAIIIIVVELYHKKNSKKPNKNSYKSIYNSTSPEPLGEPELSVYCKNCGQSLPLDSDFCHKCGTKIEKENNAL